MSRRVDMGQQFLNGSTGSPDSYVQKKRRWTAHNGVVIAQVSSSLFGSLCFKYSVKTQHLAAQKNARRQQYGRRFWRVKNIMRALFADRWLASELTARHAFQRWKKAPQTDSSRCCSERCSVMPYDLTLREMIDHSSHKSGQVFHGEPFQCRLQDGRTYWRLLKLFNTEISSSWMQIQKYFYSKTYSAPC